MAGTVILAAHSTKERETPANPKMALLSKISPFKNIMDVTVAAVKMLKYRAAFAPSSRLVLERKLEYRDAIIMVRGKG